MRRFSLRLSAAILAFAVGVAASAAFIAAKGLGPGDVPAPPHDGPASSQKRQGPALEMVFVLDTTGSMGGLLEGAKQRIWGIVNEVMQSSTSRPAVRIGLVAYRDRGDAYVTQVLPLTEDLDRVYTTLMDYRAEGGGDTPENVRRALADGVHRAGWSEPAPQVAQILFLVGDAPPHDDYQDEPDLMTTVAAAAKRGMTVNTIQCGQLADTAQVWQQVARRGEGQYFSIAQDGGVAAIATPYDARLSELGSQLGTTYMAYGGGAGEKGKEYREARTEAQAAAETKVTAAAIAPAAADRAVNKALNTRAYVGDLLQDIETGATKLDSIKEEDLPDSLQKLPKNERQAEVQKRLDARKKVRDEIVTLSRQRDEFIAAERRKKTGTAGGFDSAVAGALKSQLVRKGIK